MCNRISKISLTVFVLLLALSFSLLSIAGDYWPWYAMMSASAVVPVVAGPRRYRVMGAFALGLSVVLIASDVAEGRRLHARRMEVRR